MADDSRAGRGVARNPLATRQDSLATSLAWVVAGSLSRAARRNCSDSSFILHMAPVASLGQLGIRVSCLGSRDPTHPSSFIFSCSVQCQKNKKSC